MKAALESMPMLVTVVETYHIRYYEQPYLEEVLVDCLPMLTENTVVAIAPRLVSVCEGSITYRGKGVKVLPPSDPKYTSERTMQFLRQHFAVKNLGVAIIDSSGLAAQAGLNSNLAAAVVGAVGKVGELVDLIVITQVPFA